MRGSPFLHFPDADRLEPHSPSAEPASLARDARDCRLAMIELLKPESYPCVPALRSFKADDYLVGIYDAEIGAGGASRAVLDDLLFFRDQQKRSGSIYSTFWAIFAGPAELTEEAFETRLWNELSYISTHQGPDPAWDINFSADPQDPRFCPSFGGDAFFIVGMHPNSSRRARRFRYPAILFNLYDQFEALSRQGRYESTVRANRERELAFQGDLNPMVQKHGDKWEAIQFSGRNNPDTWKCPFHHGLRAEGPGD